MQSSQETMDYNTTYWHSIQIKDMKIFDENHPQSLNDDLAIEIHQHLFWLQSFDTFISLSPFSILIFCLCVSLGFQYCVLFVYLHSFQYLHIVQNQVKLFSGYGWLLGWLGL